MPLAAILAVILRFLPWIAAGFFTWKLERAGAVDAVAGGVTRVLPGTADAVNAVATDVQKAAEAGGKVLDLTSSGGLPLVLAVVALVALLVVKR